MQRTSILLLAAVILVPAWSAPAWSQTPTSVPHPRPGSINYVEGQASIDSAAGTSPVDVGAVGSLALGRDQTLTTQAGKVEILLTPGVFLRLADNSSVKLVSPEVANTEVSLGNGRAMVEVVDIHKENNIRIDLNGTHSKLLKRGLYDFDAEHNEVRVFNGEAEVDRANQRVTLGAREQADLNRDGLKAIHFDSKQYEDDFYRFNGLRSGFLSEASADIARTFMGPGPVYSPDWCGPAWYWNSWFGVYTFLPQDGVYYGPFGWGFYSPIAVYLSPFVYNGHVPHLFSDFHYPYGQGFPPPAGRGSRIGR